MEGRRCVTLLLAVILGLTNGEGDVSCGGGWVAGLQNTCFRFVTAKANWNSAMGSCKDLGGSLATLDTHARNAFIIGNLAMTTNGQTSGCWWIGGKVIDGKPQWLDQYSMPFGMTYTYWNQGQPDYQTKNTNEDTIQLCKYHDITETHYGWNDAGGDRVLPFVCEKKADVKEVFG